MQSPVALTAIPKKGMAQNKSLQSLYLSKGMCVPEGSPVLQRTVRSLAWFVEHITTLVCDIQAVLKLYY